MTRLLLSIQRFFLPELWAFDGQELQLEVLRNARRYVRREKVHVIYVGWLLVSFLTAGVCVCIVAVIGTETILPGWVVAVIWGIGFPAYFLTWWCVTWRPLLRDYLRKELQRQDAPLCPTCGYSLRGLVTPRCPECGRPYILK